MPALRKKKLINSSLQLKLIGTFLSIAALSALFQVIVLNRSMLEVASTARTSDELVAFVPGVLVSNIAVTFGMLLPVMFLVGVAVTHRVAGPAYAIEKYLRDVVSGQRSPTDPCRIRKGDEMQSLCDAVNEAMALVQRAREQASASAAVRVEQPASLAREARQESVHQA